MEESSVRKGVKTKLFGVVLIILGALDSMLSWRGGFGSSGVYVFLLMAGIGLYGVGSVRGSRASSAGTDDSDDASIRTD